MIIGRMRSYTILMLLALTIVSCNQDGNVHIHGLYPGGAGEYLTLEMLDISDMVFMDSVKVSKKDRFSFSFDMENPELLVLKNQEGSLVNLLAFPGDEIVLELNKDQFSAGYSVSGSKTSEQIRELSIRLETTRHKLDSITAALDSVEDKEGPVAQVLISTYQQIFQNQKRESIRFIVENINSLASIYALYQRVSPDVYLFDGVRDIQYMKIVADSAKVHFPGSSLTSSLVNDLEQRMSDYTSMMVLNEVSKSGLVETGLINLDIEDPSGNKISLKTLEGKVVLLNFWASWSNESREATRLLKPIYDQYQSRGFEIYSVSLDSEKSDWQAAINFEDFAWIDVSELTYPYSYAANAYNVKSIPSNYLIDREGNIIAKNLYGKVLATWLDNLL
jgi:peroxiredoxin